MKNRILESLGKAKLISDAAFTLFLENGYEATDQGDLPSG